MYPGDHISPLMAPTLTLPRPGEIRTTSSWRTHDHMQATKRGRHMAVGATVEPRSGPPMGPILMKAACDLRENRWGFGLRV